MVRQPGAVDQDAAAGDAVVRARRRPRERVGELVVAVEGAVGDHQRQVAVAARQRQAAPRSASSTIHMPGSPRQLLRAVRSRRWSWYHWNAARSGAPSSIEVVGVGALPARRDQQVVARRRADRPRGDVAVQRARLAPGQPPG